MTFKLEAFSPPEGIGIVRAGKDLRLVGPPYLLDESAVVPEDSIREAILKYGYSSSGEDFNTWDQLKNFLNSQVVEARRALGQQIPEINDADILEIAPADALERFLDRIELQLTSDRQFDQVENSLLTLLSNDSFLRNTSLTQRAAGLFRRYSLARRATRLAGRNPQILIVDSDESMATTLLESLSKDYVCATAESTNALSTFVGKDIPLVLFDLVKPVITPTELFSRFAPTTVVVVLSGWARDTALEAVRLGAFDYLIKPFDVRQIEEVIKRAFMYRDLIIQKAELNELNQRPAAYLLYLKNVITALEGRGLESPGHIERVVGYSLRLGQECGLHPTTMKSLELGALLHHIGMIGVPEGILRKPAKLTTEEWNIFRRHPSFGAELLRGIEPFEGAAKVVSQHHEKWDGSGYPLGLRGEEIDICARVFAVADAFDGITSDRVYRVGRSYEQAATELDDLSGRQFDPTIVTTFHQVPKEDWTEIRRHSMLSPNKESGLLQFVNAMMEVQPGSIRR